MEIDRYNWRESETKSLAGALGESIPIRLNDRFDEISMRFYYDDALLGDTREADLVLLWRQKGEDKFIITDTFVNSENHSLSAKISGFEYAEFILADNTYQDEWIDILED